MESPACPSARGQPACFLVTGSVSARLTSRVGSREGPLVSELCSYLWTNAPMRVTPNTVTGRRAGGSPGPRVNALWASLVLLPARRQGLRPRSTAGEPAMTRHLWPLARSPPINPGTHALSADSKGGSATAKIVAGTWCGRRLTLWDSVNH